jgi:hypothetical protein
MVEGSIQEVKEDSGGVVISIFEIGILESFAFLFNSELLGNISNEVFILLELLVSQDVGSSGIVIDFSKRSNIDTQISDVVFVILTEETDDVTGEAFAFTLQEVEGLGFTRRKGFSLLSFFSIGIGRTVSKDFSSLVGGDEFEGTDLSVSRSFSDVYGFNIFTIIEVDDVVVSIGVLDLVINAFEGFKEVVFVELLVAGADTLEGDVLVISSQEPETDGVDSALGEGISDGFGFFSVVEGVLAFLGLAVENNLSEDGGSASVDGVLFDFHFCLGNSLNFFRRM